MTARTGSVNRSHSGALLVDKVDGLTSHDVVDTVRNIGDLRLSKVGHAGTLDPFATGLLIVLVGEATRAQSRVQALNKLYEVEARFGARSSTGDPEGTVEPVDGRVNAQEIKSKLQDFNGEIQQSAPIYSAVKVAGERLYKKARRGETVETPVRTVAIHSIELMDFDPSTQTAVLTVRCGAGTYIRQLVSDLGTKLGSAAYCTALRRWEVGHFTVGSAVSVSELEEVEDPFSLAAWLPLTVRLGSVEI